MDKIKKNNKRKSKLGPAMLSLQSPFDPFCIDSFRKYKKKPQEQKQHCVSVSMQMPVFSQYTHLNLKKSHSRYHRISRTITQNKNLKLTNINLNSICQKNNNSICQKTNKTNNNLIAKPIMNKKNLLRSITSTSNQHSVKRSIQKVKQQKWNKQLQKYMNIKQQFSGFNREQQKFPLMKLNRCNQIKRKIMFGSNMAESKPTFIYDMETQDPKQLNYSKNKMALPGLVKSVAKNKNNSLKTSKHQVNKSKSKQKIEQISQQKYSQNEDQQMVNICKSLPRATNQDEKILVNFISQYFKQKLKSSRKKRYNYQRTYTQITAPIQININQLKQKSLTKKNQPQYC